MRVITFQLAHDLAHTIDLCQAHADAYLPGRTPALGPVSHGLHTTEAGCDLCARGEPIAPIPAIASTITIKTKDLRGSYGPHFEVTFTGLQELTGTDKQVAWATDLRQRVLTIIVGRYSESPRASMAWVGSPSLVRDALVTALSAEVAKHTAAKWWIDNGDSAAQMVIKAAVEAARRVVPS